MELLNLPMVSVAFPIHKPNAYYLQAIESIRNQNYQNIEILIIDSSQKGIPIPQEATNTVTLLRVPSTYGLSESLNTALQFAHGKYFARMDYDDLSLPERIHKQVEFMELHDDIDLVGSAAYIIQDEDTSLNSNRIVSRPLEHKDIVEFLLLKNSFLHPTVMLRLATFRKFNLSYRSHFDGAEDYDLWVRTVHKTKVANLPSPLLAIRYHSQQYSRIERSRSELLATFIKIRHLIWMAYHLRISPTKFIKVSKHLIITLMKILAKRDLYQSISKFDK